MVPTQIRELIANEVGTDLRFAVDRPPQPGQGDYASNVAMVLAGQQGGRPMSVAETLRAKLARHDLFEKIEIAQPGFLNFFVSPACWEGVIKEIVKQGPKFGTAAPTGKRIQVEFISANPTGPLTLGNGRGGFGGDVLANVLARMGHQVEREYYVNDAGFQVAQLGAALKGESADYQGPYLEELKQHVDTTQAARAVGRQAAERLTADIKDTVARMGVRFDTWFSEDKELHGTGEVQATLERLAEAGGIYEADGALWLKSTEFGDDKDRVLRKSDGALTYLAADIAYHYHKLATRKFTTAIDIWGADHHGYIKRLHAGLAFLRKQEPIEGELKILITQLVRLVEGGKEVKMSKRAGTYVALDDLLDQIPVDVARFFFVMKSFDTHMDFDLTLAKEQSEKNPVYYLKYAHARTAGILKKAPQGGRPDYGKLAEPSEIALVQALGEFPEVVRETADDYQVQRIAHFALDLADAFHKFYERCRVDTEPKSLAAARLKLVEATKVVLGNVGDTLGIEMPDRM